LTEGRPGDGPADEPTEVEVKLGVSRPAAVRQLLRRPEPARLAGFDAAAELHLVRVTDRYLDTDRVAGRLAAGLVRARLRRQGDAITLTVKRAGTESSGVTTRVELEGPATRAIEPERWPPSAARTVLIEAAGGLPLCEIAALRQRRLTRLLRRGATTVEVSLDALEALAGARVAARRYELEAELVAGEHGALAELSESLRAIDGVGPPLGSKLQFALDAVLAR
jgi:inorganic triphosphatase YgiF